LSATTLAQENRTISGTVISSKNETIEGVTIRALSSMGELKTESDSAGKFQIGVPNGPITLIIEGKNIVAQQRSIGANESVEALEIKVEFVIPPIHESVVIEASALDPTIDRRNDTLYKDTLFSRDDQVFQTLDAGINAGQHEGGGKSL